MSRTLVVIASILGALGVAFGAFGAHGLANYFAANPGAESTFDTAVRYHLIHAVALMGAAWAWDRFPSRWTRYAGWLFVAGIILFSGSLYLLSLLNIRFMGAIAPIGGACLIAGWLCIGIAAWREKQPHP